jgi:hypothetical protein
MSKSTGASGKNLRKRSALALLAVAGALLFLQQAMLWWLYYHYGAKQLVGDETRYWSLAHEILGGAAWHPSDTWPPAQPLFVALTLLAGGDSLLPVQIVQTLLFFGCGLLVFLLWRRISGSPLAAGIAAALFVLAPSNAACAQYLWPEVPHLFLVLTAFALLLQAPVRLPAAIAAGVSIGVALLFKSLLAAFWPLLLACFVVSWRPLRVNLGAAAVFVLALAVTVAPAIVAGHRNTGHWRIADSSAINLLIGLRVPDRNDYIAWPGSNLFQQYMDSGADSDQRNAWAWSKIDAEVEESSMPALLWRQLAKQYFRLFESKTLLVGQLPGPACAGYLGAYTDAPPWLALIVRWSSHLFHALILAGFAFGLCMQRSWRRLGLWLLVGFLCYQLAIYLGLLAIARYLLPMMPVMCGFAGDAYARLAGADDGASFTRARLLAGSLLAALLLLLAFAAPWIDGYCRS